MSKKLLTIIIAAVSIMVIFSAIVFGISINKNAINDDSVRVGQNAKIYIGGENSSIGTSWQIKSVSDHNIVSNIEIYSSQSKDCPPEADGCYSDAYLTLTGAQTGQTTIVVEQCFRGDCAGAQTKTFDITVK